MKAASCLGTVEKGHFVPAYEDGFQSLLNPHEGKLVRVTVEVFRKRRSDEQNRYYWSVVVALIGEKIGESDPACTHDMLKTEFNYDILTLGGRTFRKPKSTATLTTSEFMEFIAKVQRWASEFLSLYIPSPGEI